MQLKPTITFRGLSPSASLESDIRERIAKLETYSPRITGCRVLVEFGQRHHRNGNHYHVRIDLTVPGDELVVTHDASLHGKAQAAGATKVLKADEPDPVRKHARVAIRQAFDVARRKLQDYSRRMRGAVKTSVRRAQGRVVQVSPVDEYGYIAAEDGHEVYFQKESVLAGAFKRLAVGSQVSFVEELGRKGPQASTVKVLHPRIRRKSAPSPI